MVVDEAGGVRGGVPRGWTWLQLRALLFSAVVLFCDGYDLLAISYATPYIRADLQLTSAEMGQIFSMGLLGMVLGGLLLGPLADRLGLRAIAGASVLLAGLSTLLIALSENADQILALRFFSGLGLGGAMPGAFALAGDYASSNRRRTTLAVVGIAFGLGGAAVGLFSSLLLPWTSWHAIFLAGGFLTIAVGLLMIVFMPQGLSFLYGRRATQQLQALLDRLPVSVTVSPAHEAKANGGQGFPVTILFAGGWWRLTIGLWGASFLTLLTYYLLVNWIPTMLAEHHDMAGIGTQALTLMQLGVMSGGPVMGIAMDKLSSRFLIFWASVLTAVSAIAASALAQTGWPLLLCCLLIGFFQASTQGALIFTATLVYPPTARVTGIAWVLAIGRLGAMIGPLLGGAMLAKQLSLPAFFLSAAASALGAALVLLVVALAAKFRETSPV